MESVKEWLPPYGSILYGFSENVFLVYRQVPIYLFFEWKYDSLLPVKITKKK